MEILPNGNAAVPWGYIWRGTWVPPRVPFTQSFSVAERFGALRSSMIATS